MSQPDWELLANLGDVSPINHGGYFVYRDRTGVYPPKAELLESPDSDDAPKGWTVYRFCLDRCTFANGVLSDNAFHPECAAWFGDDIPAVASCVGLEPAELIDSFCSDDPLRLADAYRAVGEYHGFDNLDQDPLTFTSRAEIEARYPEV